MNWAQRQQSVMISSLVPMKVINLIALVLVCLSYSKSKGKKMLPESGVFINKINWHNI